MREQKRNSLEAAGWKVGTVAEFLGTSRPKKHKRKRRKDNEHEEHLSHDHRGR
jgi:hypothetical protein